MTTYHSYLFLDSLPSLAGASKTIRSQGEKQWTKIVKHYPSITVYAYATLGLKAQTRMMLWMQSASVEDIQNLTSDLLHTRLGGHLTISHTLFGMTAPSVYVKRPTPQEQAISTTNRSPYLIVYPFVKTTEWYLLPMETRRELMGEHMRVGHAHPTIKQLLLYSFGVDDQEFIVSYETDDLFAFQNLVKDLRATKSRAYTLRDTPIFTCVYKSLEQAVSYV